MKARKLTLKHNETGSTLLWVMTTVLVLSMAGAGVLTNATARYNVTSKQVKGWQDALGAAEAGADLGFAQVRLYGLDSTKGFATADGWASPAPSPLPATNSWTTTTPTFGEGNSLGATVTVDRIGSLPSTDPTPPGYYRIRSIGTAKVSGLKRTGMDDALESGVASFTNEKARGKGDSLLRKIDFKLDHFIATYGYGDALPSAPGTSANGKSAVPIADADFAQVTRRVELIALPIMPIEVGIKSAGSFRGSLVDSYDSKNGAWTSSNPPAPYDAYAHDGDVACATSDFYASKTIYGDVSTNGGNATNNNITGVVDNNVPFTIPPAVMGTAPLASPPPSYENTPNPSNVIDPIPRSLANGQKQTEYWYTYTSLTFLTGLTINPITANIAGVGPKTPIDTIVNIYVTGNVGSVAPINVTVNKGVTANIYFTGNMEGDANSYVNNNVDGPGGNGVYVRDYVYNAVTQTYTEAGTYSPSPLVSRAGHLWFYGISPATGSRRIDIKSSGAMWAAFYAPSHDFYFNGNPDLYGVMVCRNYYGNGNTSFHFDKQLLTVGKPVDYRVASFIEDIR